MGTLGCINDMIQRDKENRELRKLGRERRKDRLTGCIAERNCICRKE